jgi:enoyl-CoA hydratase/carnithine racemase
MDRKERGMSCALYEKRGGVGIVTLNRPERLNAINHSLLADLDKALGRGIEDDSVAVLLLTGAGRAFCSGDDLKEYALQAKDESSSRTHIQAIQKITHRLLGSEKPVVGAIHGYAVGGGFEWQLNCDLVIASENLIAFFSEMEWGSFVTGGVTHLLPAAVGYQRAMELFLLGDRQSASRLLELGLVNFVVPQEQLMTKALEVANRLAGKSRSAMAQLKRLINQDLGQALWRAVALEETATIRAFQQAEGKERIKRFTHRKKMAPPHPGPG